MTSNAASIPSEGKRAPAFTLSSSTGEKIRLSALKDSPVVMYFYPKDATPGCTIEAQEFRDQMRHFKKLGVVVLGISPDTIQSHCKFIDKQKLNFTLLADTEHKLAERYGVWIEKNMYGRKYWGVQRTTFLLDGEGKVAKVWHKVKPKGHAHEVLDAAKALI